MKWIVISIGNTNCRIAAVGGCELIGSPRIIPTRELSAPFIAGILRETEQAFPKSRAVICSVVPAAAQTAVSACLEAFGRRPVEVKPERVGWMNIHYDPVSDLGADRLCVILGARRKYGYPLIVVDFGTAVTVNVLDEKGDFAGGCIFPGIAAALRALNNETAQLPLVHMPEDPPPMLARSTGDSLRAGVYWSVVCGMEGMAARLAEEIGTEFPVILTGGGMRAAAAGIGGRCKTDEHLLLFGAAEYAARAAGRY
jgi:type III pantothenate kinase